jgi:hypothetical protein
MSCLVAPKGDRFAYWIEPVCCEVLSANSISCEQPFVEVNLAALSLVL